MDKRCTSLERNRLILTTTAVKKTDYGAVNKLLSTADRLALRIPWADVEAAIAQHPFFMVKRAGQLGCVCGVFLEPESVAKIRVLAVHDAWPVADALASLLPCVVEVMIAKKAEILVFLGTEEWLTEGLLAQGFCLRNIIITLQKMDFATPGRVTTAGVVRPATQADFPAVLDIDRAAFEPLWHHTPAMLARIAQEADYFAVSELSGKVVGYVYGSLTGRHGHISRIAVDPPYQGQGVGTGLLSKVIRFFESSRAFGITLNTQQDNARSRRLYEWFGFKLLGEEAYLLTRAL